MDVLIEALALLPGVHGLIVGGQPGERDRSRLEALARARGVADRLEFTGWLPPADVASAIGRCQILALPNVRSTISERYTSPLKLFEYLAAGRAVIASDLPALREVLTDDVNAVLVEPGHPRPLAEPSKHCCPIAPRLDRLSRAAFDARGRLRLGRAPNGSRRCSRPPGRADVSSTLAGAGALSDCRGTLADAGEARVPVVRTSRRQGPRLSGPATDGDVHRADEIPRRGPACRCAPRDRIAARCCSPASASGCCGASPVRRRAM